MHNIQEVGMRIPYESPESELLMVRLEEQFLQGTNGHGNEVPDLDDDVNP